MDGASVGAVLGGDAEDDCVDDDTDHDVDGPENDTANDNGAAADEAVVDDVQDEAASVRVRAEPVLPGPGHDGYGVDPPAGTAPISRALDLEPGQEIVALVRGRWIDGLVMSRERSSVVVRYQVAGPGFPDRQLRTVAARVRRWS